MLTEQQFRHGFIGHEGHGELDHVTHVWRHICTHTAARWASSRHKQWYDVPSCIRVTANVTVTSLTASCTLLQGRIQDIWEGGSSGSLGMEVPCWGPEEKLQ